MSPAFNRCRALTAANKVRSFNLKYLNLGIGLIIVGLGVLYLFNLSYLSVLGFKLNELKSEANFLAAAKLEKENEVNRAQSYQNLIARTQNLNMVPVSEIDYLTMPATAVAKK